MAIYPKSKAGMKITDSPSRNLAPGFSGYYVHGESLTFGMVEIKAGSSLPLHHHMHEQITCVLEGELHMIIGDEAVSLTAGTVHVIPTNTPHSAFALTDCKVIDVFNPPRQDYK